MIHYIHHFRGNHVNRDLEIRLSVTVGKKNHQTSPGNDNRSWSRLKHIQKIGTFTDEPICKKWEQQEEEIDEHLFYCEVQEQFRFSVWCQRAVAFLKRTRLIVSYGILGLIDHPALGDYLHWSAWQAFATKALWNVTDPWNGIEIEYTNTLSK